MSDMEDSYNKRVNIKRESRSRSVSRPRSVSRSMSRSRSPRSRSRSYSRSPSRSRSRSVDRKRRYTRSRSRSRSPRRGRSSYGKRRRSRSGSYNARRSSRRHSPDSHRGTSYRGRDRSHSTSPMSNRRRHVGNRENPVANTSIGVFGLSLYTTEKDLREVYSRYGPIDTASVIYDQQSGRSRGFAFISFENEDDASEAKERTNGMEIDGRRIRVDFSITKRAHTPTPGIYMGRPTYPKRGGHEREQPYESRDRYSHRSDRGDRYSRRSPSPYYSRRSPSPYYKRRYSRSRSRSYSRSPRRY